MTDSTGIFLYEKPRIWAGFVVLLLVSMLLVSVADAAPGGGKGGKGGNNGGGGGDAGSGPTPEMHFQWRVPMEASYSLVRPVLGLNDTVVYAVDVTDRLIAVDASTGAILWEVPDAGSKGVDVGPDGTIYTGNEDWIKAFNPDGSHKWTFMQMPRAFVLVDVAVGPDGHVYAVASSGMGVFSLEDTVNDAGDPYPKLRWTTAETYARPFTGYTEIAFGSSSNGDQLYFHANGHTRAVRLSDGKPIFTVGGGNTPPRVSPLDDTWHRGDSAYTPDATLEWQFEFPLAAGFSEPSLAGDGTHYAVVSANQLYAINPFGAEVFQAALNENVGIPDVDPTGSIVILDTYNTQTSPAALKAVSADTGREFWRMEFPADAGGDQFISSGVAYSATGDRAYMMTFVSTANTTYLNAVDTDPAIPSASTIVRSSDISMGGRTKRGSASMTAKVMVTDENRGPVSGATVSAVWTLPDGSVQDQVATSSGGEARFSVSGPGGIYWIDVLDITREGYTFDPGHSLLRAGLARF